VDRHVCAGQGEVESGLDDLSQLSLAETHETLVVAVEAPDVIRVLVSARQLAVETQIGAIHVWVPETRSRSCGPFVFMYKPAEDVASQHSPWQVLMLLGEMSRRGRIHVQCPVGPMTVIVR
jgi:hypothetical protein